MKVVTFVDPATGTTAVVRPVAWARLVKSVMIASERRYVDPPQPLDVAVRRAIDAAKMAAFDPEWAETEDQFMARVASRAVPKGVAYQVVNADPILDGDRTFRNALKCEAGKFSHDMTKAREIHMGAIRRARNAELGRLDVATMQAVGKGDTTARDAVEAEKQKLRDIPQTFDLSGARTPEELKALWPQELVKA